jgi:hypothetical protein
LPFCAFCQIWVIELPAVVRGRLPGNLSYLIVDSLRVIPKVVPRETGALERVRAVDFHVDKPMTLRALSAAKLSEAARHAVCRGHL